MATSEPPTITLIFNGLFLLAFERENKFCQAGVMRAENHCLKINIKTKGAPSIFPKPPLEVPEGDISLQVLRRTGSVSINGQPGTFNRNTADDWRDFRWILDMEGKHLHNRQLSFRAGALKRSIFIYNGLFYTYNTQPVSIISPSSRRKNVIVAEQIGCDIYLDDQEAAVLRFGTDPGSSIEFRKEPGVSYKISLENLCNEAHRPRPGNSDFVHYYDVIDVPKSKQFRVTRQPRPGFANARNPCNPIIVGQSKAPLS
jgi:hypothetical protein